MGNLFRRGDLAEPSPKAYQGRGPAPGYTVKEMPSVADVDAYCRENGVTPDEAFRRIMWDGCVVHDKREVILPKRGTIDDKRWAWLADHENGHSWGLDHPKGGRGWKPPGEDYYRRNPHIVRENLVGKAPPLQTRRPMTEPPPPVQPGLMTSSARQYRGQ